MTSCCSDFRIQDLACSSWSAPSAVVSSKREDRQPRGGVAANRVPGLQSWDHTTRSSLPDTLAKQPHLQLLATSGRHRDRRQSTIHPYDLSLRVVPPKRCVAGLQARNAGERHGRNVNHHGCRISTTSRPAASAQVPDPTVAPARSPASKPACDDRAHQALGPHAY
jgi:hypothetical protein